MQGLFILGICIVFFCNFQVDDQLSSAWIQLVVWIGGFGDLRLWCLWAVDGKGLGGFAPFCLLTKQKLRFAMGLG